MGEDFDSLISSTNTDITLNLNKVHFIGQPGGGEFLEGIDVRDEGFEDWLRGIRTNPEQIYSLFSLTSQAPTVVSIPTIAILPFRLIAGDVDQKILGDWLAEEVCRSLSALQTLSSVISHLSSSGSLAALDRTANMFEKKAVSGLLRMRQYQK